MKLRMKGYPAGYVPIPAPGVKITLIDTANGNAVYYGEVNRDGATANVICQDQDEVIPSANLKSDRWRLHPVFPPSHLSN